MENEEKRWERNKAIWIGLICVLAYCIDYYFRKLLGAGRPLILEEGVFSTLVLDNCQSVYMLTYAIGCLLNGVIGDYVPPRRMISIGFGLGGISMLLFTWVQTPWVALLCFMMLGYGLSMMRGPMMKVIAENTLPDYARVICSLFRFGSLLGTPIASVFMVLFHWKEAFLISGILSLSLAAVLFVLFFRMEKRGLIRPARDEGPKERLTVRRVLGFFSLRGFLFYFLLDGLVETSATTITYFLPSYIHDYLGQSADFSNLTVTVLSIAIAACAFLALFLFYACKKNDLLVVRIMMPVALLAFAGVMAFSSLWVNLILLVLGLMAFSCTSGMLWGVYIPSLGKTGKVSGANGVIDCFGYLVATAMTEVMSFVSRSVFGWRGVIGLWIGLAAAGLVLAFVKKEKNVEE